MPPPTDYLDSTNFELHANATTPDMTGASRVYGLTQMNDDADTQETTVRLMGEDPLTSTGKNPRSFDGAGVVSAADAGQAVLADAYESQATIYLILFEEGSGTGKTGTVYPVKITSYGRQRSADDTKIRYSFTASVDGTATEITQP